MVGQGELMDRLSTLHKLVSDHGYSLTELESMLPYQLEMIVAVVISNNKEKEELLKQSR